MRRIDLVSRVRSLTRDISGGVFREDDILNYVSEGIDRIIQVVPMLSDMEYLGNPESEPALLPRAYHHILAVYSASRCFSQDERHYQATTLMNEFETKLNELRASIDSGEITIVDKDGNPVEPKYVIDYVVDNYFTKNRRKSKLKVEDVNNPSTPQEGVDGGGFETDGNLDGGSFTDTSEEKLYDGGTW